MPSVDLVSARTAASDPNAAAEEICRQFGAVKPKLVTLFASRDRDQTALNKALRERLPAGTRLLGATTGGEIDREGMHRGTIIASALTGDFDVGIGSGRDLSIDAAGAGQAAIDRACDELGVKGDVLSSKKYVAMVIDDGFRFKKEEMLLGVMSKNQGLVAVGGGASDSNPDPSQASSEIHVDGDVFTNGVAVALFRTDAPWAALRSHWYQPTGRTLRVTKVDSTTTRALEIDGKPAAKRYAELLGVTVDDLEFGKPNGFAIMPTALRVGREYFLRAPWKPLDDGSILFANMLEEGCELELVRFTDIGGSTRRFLETELPARVQSPRALIMFHCSGRKWFAEGTGRSQELSEAFRAAPPSAGMNCHFEIYCGFHINTTLTALAFGASA